MYGSGHIAPFFSVVMLILTTANGILEGKLPDTTVNNTDLKLEPLEAIVYAGDNVTFTCYSPHNVTFNWDLNDGIRPTKILKGMSRKNGSLIYWSKLSIPLVRRTMSGEIICSIQPGRRYSTEAFLIVNGVQIGGACTVETDCTTDKARCQKGICACPRDEVLLKFTKSGYEVCRKMIYRLYDPCEFSEQCFHLVDSKSVCGNNGVCICASWATDVDGKCIAKSEMAYNKNQELYRVGLVAITCLIIIIVAISLWITLRRSCQIETIDTQLHSITQNDEQASDEISLDIRDDKPPSYDDLESNDTITSPPNFKEALTSSVTDKKFLRQSSAPAGQLLCTAIISPHPRGKMIAKN